MAYQTIWEFTNLPIDIVKILEKDLENNFDNEIKDSTLYNNTTNKLKRNSSNAWIPTNHWVAGFLWHYIQKANRQNFLYDLSHIDGESIQYTRYEEGQYYGWHNDADLANAFSPKISNISAFQSIKDENYPKEKSTQQYELVRKLSFTLQLSHPDDYEGGNIQFIDESGKLYIAPRMRGAFITFDSRTQHRVLKVTKGVRKSIVGWVVGSRWK